MGNVLVKRFAEHDQKLAISNVISAQNTGGGGGGEVAQLTPESLKEKLK